MESNLKKDMTSIKKAFNDFPLQTIKRKAKEQCRQIFEEVISQHPNEEFYKFGLYSDNSLDTLGAMICSLQKVERLEKEKGKKLSSYEKWIEVSYDSSCFEIEELELKPDLFDLDYEEYDESSENYDPEFELTFDPEDEYKKLRKSIISVFLEILEELDNEKFFERNMKREEVMVQLFPSPDIRDEDIENLKRLNTNYETLNKKHKIFKKRLWPF